METKVVKIDENCIDEKAQKALKEAGEILLNGGLVAFPTETVYGLGGDARNAGSSKKIYAAKGRPSDNPLIVHIYKVDDLYKVSSKVTDEAIKLANKFWPGPLTMILPKSDLIPLETTGGMETVAIRMPSNKIAAKMIEEGGGFIAAPSANTSGRPSPTMAKYCIEDLDGKIEMIIDGGQVGIGLESTIVDLTENVPVILRPGYITYDMLKEVVPNITIDKTIIDPNSKQKPKAPGMKYRHYAPKGDLTIVEGSAAHVVEYINEMAKKLSDEGHKVGIIATTDNFSKYHADVVKNAGSRQNEEEVARQLFKILREFDDENVEYMFSESFDENGIGQAIMNRLLKAAGGHVVCADRN